MNDERRVIVVGSGPSGAMAALTLLQRGVAVTMLESGPRFRSGLMVRAFGRNIYRKWAPEERQSEFVSSGDPWTEWHNTLTPGGLSNYWTGAVPRFAPRDFSEGERLHDRYRWPIDYADLAPYYTLAERLLGVVGERRAVPQLPSAEAIVHERHLPHAWRRIAEHSEYFGQGLVYAPIADGPPWLVRRSGAAFNSFERIVRPLRRFPNFELRLGAHVQRLVWHAAGARISGVEYVDRSTGASQYLAGAAVVVAAGPMTSPKLLLQSTSSDFPAGLGNTHGVLGHFLHDHPKDWCVLALEQPLPRLDQPLHLSRAPYAESPPLMAASMTIGALSKWDRLLSFSGATTRHFGVATLATMLPVEDNYLSLYSKQHDEFGMPILNIHMRFGDEVAQTVLAARARLRSVLEHAGMQASLNCPIQYLKPGNSVHYGGGVRMHASARYGMLDGWNRIHDVQNVAVVDASSFTTGVEKNPTLTVMALAARAADRLADDFISGALAPRGERSLATASLR